MIEIVSPVAADTLHVDSAVRERYSQAAQCREASLCCAVASYDRRFLEVIPQEIIDRDYGCGDPSRFVRAGDVVLDLGSGGGKICYIAAQVVGAAGRVIGIDCNEDMLALARKYQRVVGERLGFLNVEFIKGRIQDLRPHIERETIDVVISNCVLNLVRREDRQELFAEMFRVLKPNGRAAISDIVASADVPEKLQNDPQLWSGCVSGAFREDRFLDAFRAAGFAEVEIVARQDEPWAVVEGIEFRSVTVQAFKGTRDSSAECVSGQRCC